MYFCISMLFTVSSCILSNFNPFECIFSSPIQNQMIVLDYCCCVRFRKNYTNWQKIGLIDAIEEEAVWSGYLMTWQFIQNVQIKQQEKVEQKIPKNNIFWATNKLILPGFGPYLANKLCVFLPINLVVWCFRLWQNSPIIVHRVYVWNKISQKIFSNKMESTIAVIVLILCISFYEIGAKTTNLAGQTDSNRLDGEISELTANELSIQIDNCHEACLQKVCTITLRKRSIYQRRIWNCALCLLCAVFFLLL